MYEVRLTETAFQCLADIESFKTATIGSVDAGHFVDQLLLEATATLREDPKRYRFNATLADYGLGLRERLDKHETGRCMKSPVIPSTSCCFCIPAKI